MLLEAEVMCDSNQARMSTYNITIENTPSRRVAPTRALLISTPICTKRKYQICVLLKEKKHFT